MDVLLVEDNPKIRNRVWEQLELEGYDVGVARNGEEALEAISHKHPRVVITDLYMPVMNGWDLVKNIREDPGACYLPIITMSTIRDVTPPEGTSFIKKPINYERLLNLLDKSMRRPPSPTA